MKKTERNATGQMRTEKNMVWITVFAAVIGVCLAVGCTKMIIPTYYLSGYGFILIVAGILIIMFDYMKHKEKRGIK